MSVLSIPTMTYTLITNKPLPFSSHSKKPLTSAMKKHKRTVSKHVHWHSDVVDNKCAVLAEHAYLQYAKEPSNQALLRRSRSHQQLVGPCRIEPLENLGRSRKRSQTSLSLTRNVERWITDIPVFERNANQTTLDRRMSFVPPFEANSGRKRDSRTAHSRVMAIERQAKSYHAEYQAPPAVPDPPYRHREGPPPTPRISRLPTPDLPEITDQRFPSMWSSIEKSSESRMAGKLEAARAMIAKDRGSKSPKIYEQKELRRI